jgi:glycosyltransferase involved in cell wall biosynthesis
MISFCITTHNRYEVFKKTYDEILKFMPKDSELIVVDDASERPVKEAAYRFEKNVGIARAKNKCLELAKGDHIFLLDDDTYGLKKNWFMPYIGSKEPHLMYIFRNFKDTSKHSLRDCEEVYRDSEIVGYSHVRGCMLYVERRVLDIVGGFDVRYGKAMYEHTDWSNRIYNAGLTSMRVMDVVDSDQLIYSADEHQTVSSSINPIERNIGLRDNKQKHINSLTSTEYCEYRENQNNIIIASYLTSQIDPQRGIKWEANFDDLKTLIDSVEKTGQKLIILNDCFKNKKTKHYELIKVEAVMNPYFQRWLSAWQYLRDKEYNKVLLVDATDVELLKNPFEILTEKLWCGDEPGVTRNTWMIKKHPNEPVRSFLRQNASKRLLNCGVVGGSQKNIMKLCSLITDYYFRGLNKETVEMGLFNYVMRKHFDFTHGKPLTTRFKAFEKPEDCYVRHK